MVIDDVRLSDQFLLPPVAVDDTATVIQGETKVIDILTNDTDEDGTIVTDSIQIATEPTNGAVTVTGDGTVSYTPNEKFVGEDSFTYTVQDNDNQQSEPATVNVTVENAAPEITEIVIPENITEGDEIVLSAIAHTYGDNGNYEPTLTITDNDGATSTEELTVTVNNVAPVISDLTDDLIIKEGDTASLNVTATDAGNDELTYAWDFGDGTDTIMGQNVIKDTASRPKGFPKGYTFG